FSPSFPTRRSSDLESLVVTKAGRSLGSNQWQYSSEKSISPNITNSKMAPEPIDQRGARVHGTVRIFLRSSCATSRSSKSLRPRRALRDRLPGRPCPCRRCRTPSPTPLGRSERTLRERRSRRGNGYGVRKGRDGRGHYRSPT